ncbi:LacI family DNA-binding transcriptional regulator [Tessaracoccus sp. Z1128]
MSNRAILSAMATTMREVAALAGVSIKTVSRVVNGEPHTRPEVVHRVRAAVAELGWTPNTSARNLRTGRTGTIAIAVPGLRRPYLAALVEVLVDEVSRRGFDAAVEPTRGDAFRLRAVLSATGRTHDGVVIIGDLPPGIAASGAEPPPVVVIQGARVDVALDRVDEDVAVAAALLSRHLVVMGRSCPVVLGADRGHGLERGGEATRPSQALRAALAAVDIDVEQVPFVACGPAFDRAAGMAAALTALERHPEADAYLCANDEVALGALVALASRGVQCPEVVAVLGSGNLVDGRFSSPSLTTVDPHPRAMARAALDLLADRIEGRQHEGPRAVTIPVDLVRRESTMGRRRP